jgi:hypothetical protein
MSMWPLWLICSLNTPCPIENDIREAELPTAEQTVVVTRSRTETVEPNK